MKRTGMKAIPISHYSQQLLDENGRVVATTRRRSPVPYQAMVAGLELADRHPDAVEMRTLAYPADGSQPLQQGSDRRLEDVRAYHESQLGLVKRVSTDTQI